VLKLCRYSDELCCMQASVKVVVLCQRGRCVGRYLLFLSEQHEEINDERDRVSEYNSS